MTGWWFQPLWKILKSIESKLKSIESKMKSIESKLKSIEIYHFFLTTHYSVPGPLKFLHYSVTKISLGGAYTNQDPTLVNWEYDS